MFISGKRIILRLPLIHSSYITRTEFSVSFESNAVRIFAIRQSVQKLFQFNENMHKRAALYFADKVKMPKNYKSLILCTGRLSAEGTVQNAKQE